MERRAISVRGIVQGVGFRPFVHHLASRYGLRGFVRNQTDGVLIEVEGKGRSLDRFLTELTSQPPPLVQIDEVRWVARRPRGDPLFQINLSTNDATGVVFHSPDVATCDDCLVELFDLRDRRYRYPFLNCTNCGPRFTIIRGAPYDRERTTMESFAMCPACLAEYQDPSNRRFHAEPIACPACGPRLQALDAHGQSISSEDPLAAAGAALRQGRILALKGLGGYHLACLATDGRVVSELRRRKHRDEKPFAIMVRDPAEARRIAELSPAEEALLVSRRRPIVLLRRRAGVDVADSVAPGTRELGLMLPYTPLHHLLLDELGATPLVMTSGNRADEPIAYDDHDAQALLSGIADLYMTNNRSIHMRCDDSVTRFVAGDEMPIRRSRGYSPQPLRLPIACLRHTLALGGQLKATFALGRDRLAILSHHIGDLDHFEAYRSYTEAITHYERLFAFRPEFLAHDLHPDYASTRYAAEHPALVLLGVQHHHAHISSCMAEHGLNEPVIGVAFDGTGYGADGAVWGGEFLTGDYRAFRRAAHLMYVPMPGGDQAIREPWRMAAAHLVNAGYDLSQLREYVHATTLAGVHQQIERRFNAPLTSSVGRLFDAVAALAGVRQRVSYEGQAAIELEGLASTVSDDGVYPFAIECGSSLVIDTRPLIAQVAEEARNGCEASVIGRRFHSTLVEMIARVCSRLAEETGIRTVVLSGGVFMNVLLTTETVARLTRDGLRVYRHRRVPTNDGGLCLGQLAIAAAWQESGVVSG
ncbi:carbamoyltransferase HypF [Isosphaeraceae bacterium EP7]